jgi:hypothetical protein
MARSKNPQHVRNNLNVVGGRRIIRKGGGWLKVLNGTVRNPNRANKLPVSMRGGLVWFLGPYGRHTFCLNEFGHFATETVLGRGRRPDKDH